MPAEPVPPASGTALLRRAAVVLKSRLDASPGDGDLALALAEAFYRLALASESPEEKARLLERARGADPYDPRPHLALAALRAQAGDPRSALDSLRSAAALAPADPEPWRRAGVLLLSVYRTSARPKLRLADRALESFEKALEIEPRDEASQLGRLAAAAEARVASPDRSRVARVAPSSLGAIAPSPDRARLVATLALSSAFALHFPRHAYSTNPKERPTEADRSARADGLRALAEALRPWLVAFPGDGTLSAARAAIDLLEAPDDALTERAAEALTPLEALGLFHLFLHQRLEEAPPARRLELASALSARLPLVSGVTRELLAARGLAAREAVVEGRLAEAARLWKDGLEVDPQSRPLHHDLALAALASRDAQALEIYAANARDLLLFEWSLDRSEERPLRMLAARVEGIAHRLRAPVQVALQHAATLDGGLVRSWIGATREALVLRAILLSGDAGRPDGTLHDAVVAWLRSRSVLATDDEPVPEALTRYLDPEPTGTPPLHFEALGLALSATKADVEAKLPTLREEARRQQAEALVHGQSEAAARAGERLARIEAAAPVLLDDAQRKAYLDGCIPEDEHAFHIARRQLIVDLHELAQKAHEAGRQDLLALVLAAYFATPHERLEPFFGALQPDASRAIRANLTTLRFKELIDAAQEEMKAERWRAAAGLLWTVFSSGGASLRPVLFLLALCEMKAEMEHVEKSGRLSGWGEFRRTDARERAKALGPASPPVGGLDPAALLSALKLLQELELLKKRQKEEKA